MGSDVQLVCNTDEAPPVIRRDVCCTHSAEISEDHRLVNESIWRQVKRVNVTRSPSSLASK